MNPLSLSVLLFSFGVFLIAVFSFAKRKDGIAVRFSLFSVSVCGWGFLYSLWTSQNYSPEVRLLLIRISEIFAVFIPITWLHFVLEFIGKKEPVKYFYRVNYAFAIFLAALCPTPLFFTGIHPVAIFGYYKTAGPAFYLFLALFLILVPYAFYHLVQAYRAAVEHRREQLKWVILGWLISFIAGTTTFFPVYNITAPCVLLLAMPLYPVFIGIALIRYGLFDLHQIANAFHRDKLAAIGTLATSINHEIRNPLYVIRGMAESHLVNLKEGVYASKEEAINKANEILSKTMEHSQRAMDIMKRFSEFAKQGAKEKFEREETHLSETLEDVLPLVGHELELDKIKLVKNIPETLPPIHADRRQIEEIFFNLIVNACQAMKNGGEIEISAERQNGHINVSVKDTGPGIPSDELPKIFEPFYTTKESGTGLGLYITKQLVERNHGRISLESKLNEGTCFLLSFPVV